MSWRTVVISNRCKLDLKMGYMVIRAEDTKRVFLDEISVLIIENNAVSMTGCLLEALCEKKEKVIFCDSKRNPMSELVPIYGSHDSSRKVREQIKWKESTKGSVWTAIVTEKIKNQSLLLDEAGEEEASKLLKQYISQLEYRDASNREGHAAKVYFNALFGGGFSRGGDFSTNAALNYGYAILLGAFNREIAALGSTAVNESYYMRTNELTAEIERYINDISFDLPCNVECNKLTIQSLIKAMGITICDDYDNDAERIIDYMELVREFDRDKLFITVNMRSYFTDDTMQLFCDTAVSHGFRLLMIDNMQYKRLNGEKRLTIDADMCVF